MNHREADTQLAILYLRTKVKLLSSESDFPSLEVRPPLFLVKFSWCYLYQLWSYTLALWNVSRANVYLTKTMKKMTFYKINGFTHDLYKNMQR